MRFCTSAEFLNICDAAVSWTTLWVAKLVTGCCSITKQWSLGLELIEAVLWMKKWVMLEWYQTQGWSEQLPLPQIVFHLTHNQTQSSGSFWLPFYSHQSMHFKSHTAGRSEEWREGSLFLTYQCNSVRQKVPSVTPGPVQLSFRVHSVMAILSTQQHLEFPRRQVSGSICEGVSRSHGLGSWTE